MSEQSDDTVPSAPSAWDATISPDISNPNDLAQGTFGPYVLRERIGMGGMGQVWRADQTSPVRRTVALKLIKAGMDSKEVLARFDAERQALALMDHPCIAKVFDAGATPEGRPYFAMEYVHGIPITEYCDQRRLSPNDRLHLFIKVCEGVQHAHQKAILHRDLKPSNILVAEFDGRPLPKIIDFGIAKATTQRLTESTMYTVLGQLLGTPEYMSPEQADPTTEDVDTRTDVYSLGVILYELLVGALPFEPEDLRKAGFSGLVRMLQEQDPPRPSTKLAHLGDRTRQAAQNRGTGPHRLTTQLRGDLDWITMRCLEKDRNRRYGSPAELAQDLQRHLDHEPVVAGPPQASYRVSKFVRRHRAAVAMTTGAALALIAFAVITTIQSRAVARARDRATAEAAKATAMNEFLTRTLASADPWAGGTRHATVVQVLDAAADEVGTTFANQPAVEASMRATLGEAYLGLGRLEPASTQVARALEIHAALGDTDPRAMASLEILESRLAKASDDYEKAVDAAATAVRELENAPSVPLAELVRAHQHLAQSLLDAQRFAEADSALSVTEALASRLEGKDRLYVAENMSQRATLFNLRDGDPASAASLSRQAYELARAIDPNDPHLAVYMDDAAQYHSQTGDLEGALADFDLAVELNKRIFGEDHPEYATCVENRGGVLYRLGRADETLAALEQVYDIRARNLGPDHIDAIRTRLNMGTVAMLTGDNERALAIYRELEPRLVQARGTDHPDVLTLLRNEGVALRHLDRSDEALDQFNRTLEISRRMYGDDHPRTALALYDGGDLLLALARFDEARTRLTQAFEIYLAKSEANNPRTVLVAKSLVTLAEKTGDEKAAARYREHAGK
jgi:serine/threonine protein kinase/tetratricopeptide (TPR) repeat protein